MKALPRSRYTRLGQYRLSSHSQALAQAVDTLKNIATAPQAYYSQGPATVIAQIEYMAQAYLQALAAAVRDLDATVEKGK